MQIPFDAFDFCRCATLTLRPFNLFHSYVHTLVDCNAVVFGEVLQRNKYFQSFGLESIYSVF